VTFIEPTRPRRGHARFLALLDVGPKFALLRAPHFIAPSSILILFQLLFLFLRHLISSLLTSSHSLLRSSDTDHNISVYKQPSTRQPRVVVIGITLINTTSRTPLKPKNDKEPRDPDLLLQRKNSLPPSTISTAPVLSICPSRISLQTSQYLYNYTVNFKSGLRPASQRTIIRHLHHITQDVRRKQLSS